MIVSVIVSAGNVCPHRPSEVLLVNVGIGDALSNNRELEILDFNETEEANDAVMLIPRPLVAWPAGSGY